MRAPMLEPVKNQALGTNHLGTVSFNWTPGFESDRRSQQFLYYTSEAKSLAVGF